MITSQGDKEFSSDVAVNLNNQNRIETSFLRSNEPRVVQLAAALERVGWYLERREDEVSHLSTLELKDHIVLRNEQPSTLLATLEAGDFSAIYDRLAVILQFARDNPTAVNKSWPTLLKSQPFFENVASYLRGRVGPRDCVSGGRAALQSLKS